MSLKDEWPIGGRVYVVEKNHRRQDGSGYWASITKVGRKWVSYEREDGKSPPWGARFDPETMRVDDGGFGYSAGRVFLSKHEYEAKLETAYAWDQFSSLMRHQYGPPKHLTADDIREVLARLFPLGPKP